jgi:hypothetical protein
MTEPQWTLILINNLRPPPFDLIDRLEDQIHHNILNGTTETNDEMYTIIDEIYDSAPGEGTWRRIPAFKSTVDPVYEIRDKFILPDPYINNIFTHNSLKFYEYQGECMEPNYDPYSYINTSSI